MVERRAEPLVRRANDGVSVVVIDVRLIVAELAREVIPHDVHDDGEQALGRLEHLGPGLLSVVRALRGAVQDAAVVEPGADARAVHGGDADGAVAPPDQRHVRPPLARAVEPELQPRPQRVRLPVQVHRLRAPHHAPLEARRQRHELRLPRADRDVLQRDVVAAVLVHEIAARLAVAVLELDPGSVLVRVAEGLGSLCCAAAGAARG